MRRFSLFLDVFRLNKYTLVNFPDSLRTFWRYAFAQFLVSLAGLAKKSEHIVVYFPCILRSVIVEILRSLERGIDLFKFVTEGFNEVGVAAILFYCFVG